MKTLTTLTAAVALIAGMSMANAAGTSMGHPAPRGNTMMGKVAHVTGTKKYCMKTKSGTLNCKFASLQSCKKMVKSSKCVINPRAGSTTGSGMMKHSSGSMEKSK